MSFVAIGSVIGGVGAGLIGSGKAADANRQAMALIQQSVTELQNTGIPAIEAMKISMEKYKQAGVLSPELENDIYQAKTEADKIQLDPRLQDTQMGALDELVRTGQMGGMRLTDVANYEKSLGDIASRERGGREAILQDMAQRGATTGGASLAAQLSNQQQGAQQRHQDALSLSGKAQDVALQSILQSGQLGGQIREQQFGEQSRRAQAQDVINQSNVQASRATQQRNVAERNQAQQANLGALQSIWNANTGLSNEEERFNKGLIQQDYNNRFAKQQAIANARAGQASNITAAGQQQAQMWGGIGSGIAKAGIGLASTMGDSKPKPTDPEAGVTPMAKNLPATEPTDSVYAPRYKDRQLREY